MICQSCGANTKDESICEYCGTKIAIVDVSDVLVEEESKKAKILDLKGDLSYIFSNKDDELQITDRIIEKSKDFLENEDLKRAEFLVNLGLKRQEDDQVLILLAAEVNAMYAIKTSGSVQMANIKKKYIKESKEHLDKITSDSLKKGKEDILNMLDVMDGTKASQFDQPGTISSGTAGCATIFGWIIGAIFILSYIITMVG
tara:strand:- start:2647 stop:3249 length:603 start_codon:yes stop_codon:yes gene_type:complete